MASPSSAKMFTFMMVSFALITVYMLVSLLCLSAAALQAILRLDPMQAAAGFITAKGIINVKAAIEADGGKFTINDVFANAIFRCVYDVVAHDRREMLTG